MAKLTSVECEKCTLRMRVDEKVVKVCHNCGGKLKPAEKVIISDPLRKQKNRRTGRLIALAA